VDEAIGDLPPIPAGGRATAYNAITSPSEYAKFIRNGAKALTLHEATAHSERMLEIIRLSGSNINALPDGLVTSGFSSCYSRLDGDQPSVTMTVNFVHPASNRCIHPHQDRALTVREGARLQGFFDTFAFTGTRSQIVKQIGNAVPPPLGQTIAQAILESD
jgi:DNA (cytosine-5)-methyltransferase 1